MSERLDIHGQVPQAVGSLLQVSMGVRGSGLDPKLVHLIARRVSQINGCAFCVQMHSGEARQAGESTGRLDTLPVWWTVPHFTPAEKAALAWAEALTRLDPAADLDRLHGELKAHYGDAEIAWLTTAVATINAWNRLGVASHNVPRA